MYKTPVSRLALALPVSLLLLSNAWADIPYFHGGAGFGYSTYRAACQEEAQSVIELRMIGAQLDLLRTRPDRAPVTCQWLKEMKARLQFFSSREEIVVDRSELPDNGFFFQHHWMPGGAALVEERTVLPAGEANCAGSPSAQDFENQYGERVISCERSDYYCDVAHIECTFWKFGKNPVSAATGSFDRLIRGIDEICGESDPESVKREASELLREGVRPLDEAQNHILPLVCNPADITAMNGK